ncbi:MAG: hypothetical protein J5669_06640 [Bacteroidales bacterium]|nr:hypothetical protein [Bacteroidales bacterium]
MVSSSRIDIHSLTLDELTGVVNLYPWYGGARVELGRRVARMGGDTAGLSDEALYIPDRSILSRLVPKQQGDYADKDLRALLEKFLSPSAPDKEEEHAVRVVGGDYFSQAQYDNVRQGGDNIFSRFAMKSPSGTDADSAESSDMADRFPTETLARIFAEQGRSEEARRIYSRLILENPEKSAYFASLIDELE